MNGMHRFKADAGPDRRGKTAPSYVNAHPDETYAYLKGAFPDAMFEKDPSHDTSCPRIFYGSAGARGENPRMERAKDMIGEADLLLAVGTTGFTAAGTLRG